MPRKRSCTVARLQESAQKRISSEKLAEDVAALDHSMLPPHLQVLVPIARFGIEVWDKFSKCVLQVPMAWSNSIRCNLLRTLWTDGQSIEDLLPFVDILSSDNVADSASCLVIGPPTDPVCASHVSGCLLYTTILFPLST